MSSFFTLARNLVTKKGAVVKMHEHLLDILAFLQEFDDELVRIILVWEPCVELVHDPVKSDAFLPGIAYYLQDRFFRIHYLTHNLFLKGLI